MKKNKIVVYDKSVARIASVKLIVGGLKGIKISYETMESEDRQNYSNKHNDERHRPVQHEIKDFMRSLKPYLLELSGYSYAPKQDGYAALEMCTEVTGITSGTDRFLISGTVRSWEDKIIAVNTPLIKEGDAYDKFNEVIEIVDNIYKESDLYMRGAKRATKQEIVVDYMKEIKKASDFNYSMFEEMNVEEQSKLMEDLQKELGIEVVDENGEPVISSSISHTTNENEETEEYEDFELPIEKSVKLKIG